MPSSTIILSVTKGTGTGNVYLFKEPAQYVLGRAVDCDIRLTSDPANVKISRYHCKFIVDSTHVRVTDLGSLNGTYVNGNLIGKRSSQGSDDTPLPNPTKEYELQDGDEVRVGGTVFRVGILAKNEKAEPIQKQIELTYSTH